MFGFVKINIDRRHLGGEIFKAKQKRQRIILTIFAAAGFLLLNIIFLYLTQF